MKLLAAAGAPADGDLRPRPEQQPHPDGCRPPDIVGAWLDRSLVAKAARRSLDIPAMRGAVRMARGAGAAQLGQGRCKADSAMGRTSEKLPQAAQQIYAKLGVEDRTAAAALVLTLLGRAAG